MADVKIVTIVDTDREAFYRFAGEYLPDSDYEKVRSREKDYPKAFLALMDGERIIGAAFGWPRRLDVPEDMSLCLDGIAVEEGYQRKGYGPRLLAEIEKAARQYGCPMVSVGSAGSYVEKFYIENGFIPQTYKVYDREGITVEKVFDGLQDYYDYQRQNPDGFVVLEKTL